MSFNITQPIDSETAAAKANKIGDDFTNPATWRSRMDVPENAEARRLSQPEVSSTWFDGVTAGTLGSAILTGQSVGTGDFTLWVRCRLPATLSATRGIAGLTPSASSLLDAANVAIGFAIIGSASDVALVMGNTTDSTQYNLGIGTKAGRMVDLVVTRTSGTIAAYVDGTAVSLSGVNTGSGAAAGSSISSTYLNFGGRFSAAATSPFLGAITRLVAYNRSLSASEVGDLLAYGVDPADQWGRIADRIGHSTLNGGFETAGGGGSDVVANWTETVAGTTAVVRDTTTVSPNLGSAASARIDIDASVSNGSLLSDVVLVPGRRYQLSLDYRQNTAGNLGCQYSSGGSGVVVGSVAPNTWGTITATFIADGTFFSISRPFAAGASKSIWYDNVVLRSIGAFCDLDLRCGVGTHFADVSGNGQPGIGSGAIAHTLPRRNGVMVVSRVLGHADISSSSGTTKLLDLPANCGILRVEMDRSAAFDGGITLDVGTAGTPTKFIAAQSVAGTGIVLGASSDAASQSSSASTPVYVKKSGSTTTGSVTVRVVYEIRG